jgi:hypothetical protein
MSDIDMSDHASEEEEQGLEPVTDEEDDDVAAEAASKPCLDYITKMAVQSAPRNQEEYLQRDSDTILLPCPIKAQQRAAAAGDGELASKPLDPVALLCAGTSVTAVVWHWNMLLHAVWGKQQCGGNKKGTMPPCPCCYDFRKPEQQQQQQQGRPAAEFLPWDKDKCGTVTSHKWNLPLQRFLTMTGKPGYMLVQQYKCRGCPGGCERGDTSCWSLEQV